MTREYLASGFAAVDRNADVDCYERCLRLLDGLPYFQAYKRRSYELLGLAPGLSVLEVGCGLGDDARRLAKQLGPAGRVVGVDASRRLLASAAARTPRGLPVVFVQADARTLPFAARRFARVRVDRTLQHIADPERAIRELVRVLEPGGRLLAYDNDWGTFAIAAADCDEAVTRRIQRRWEDAIVNRWIGRHLKACFLAAGLDGIAQEPSVSVLTDFDLADQVYNLRETVRRAVADRDLTPTAAAQWLEQVQTASDTGGFLCMLTAHTVVGTRPG